jgi:hypothetical protein
MKPSREVLAHSAALVTHDVETEHVLERQIRYVYATPLSSNFLRSPLAARHNKKTMNTNASPRSSPPHISWRTFVELGALSSDEVGLLRDYDKQEIDDKQDVLDERGTELASVLLRALIATDVPSIVEYLLAMISHMLTIDASLQAERADLFHRHGVAGADADGGDKANAATASNNNSGGGPYVPFLRILARNARQQVDSLYCVTEASHILSLLFSNGSVPGYSPGGISGDGEGAASASSAASSSAEIDEYMSWLGEGLTGERQQSSGGVSQVVCLQHLKNVLKHEHSQTLFLRRSDGVRNLCGVLRKETTNTQIMYLAIFALWLLSFNWSCIGEFHAHNVAKHLTDTLRSVLREKVVRVALACRR